VLWQYPRLQQDASAKTMDTVNMNSLSSARPGFQRGFTLIEIMVVVIILGILVSLIAPNVFGVLDDAEKTATRVQIRNLEVALDTYRMNHSRYPTTDEGLEILLNPPGRDRGYIDVIPKDSWNNEFQYRAPGQRGDYDLWSLGRDGQDGGEGLDADIGNWQTD
jgi:general secretion pathway protein G